MPEGTPSVITPTDYHSAVFPLFPQDIQLANGDHIYLPWYDGEEIADYGEQGTADSPDYPYGTYSILWESVRDATHRHYSVSAPVEIEDEITDDITFQSTPTLIDTYDVTNRDITTVTSLEATVGGTPGTPLTEGVDFEINDEDTDGLNESIKFLGPTYPDDGTDFTVVYKARLGREHRVIRSIVTLRLSIHVKDLAIGGGANTARDIDGATKRYNKSHLASQVAEFVLAHLHIRQGQGLRAGDPGGLTVGAAYAVGRTDIEQSQSVASYVIDLYLKRKYRNAVDDFFFIGEARFDTTVE